MPTHLNFPIADDGPTIDLARPDDVALWCGRLGVSADALRDAVMMVGPGLADVRQHLAIAELAYHRPPLMVAQQRRFP